MDKPSGRGTLFVVATPIGTLSDLTFRALDTLKSVDGIACEDTRRTLQLLNHYGIRKPLASLFGPKETREAPRLVERLLRGEDLALVTDAGTPGLSDPGNALVRLARSKGVPVLPVPGASAAACALSVCGFADEGHVFVGFLPRSPNKVRKALRSAAQAGLPVVLFESPFRAVKTLELAREVFGPEAECFIGREMTKKFEEYLAGTLSEALETLKGRKEVLGEFTILLRLPQAAHNKV